MDKKKLQYNKYLKDEYQATGKEQLQYQPLNNTVFTSES